MVQIVGKYEHVSNSPEFEHYIKALGAPETTVKALIESKPIITISEAGGQWTIKASNAGRETSSTFKLGEPYDEALPHGPIVKSVTKREGDKFIIETTSDDKSGIRVYEFTDAGITVTLSSKISDKKAIRTYKRI